METVLAERTSPSALTAAIEFTEEQNRQVAAERAKTAEALLDARLAQERAVREAELTAIAANHTPVASQAMLAAHDQTLPCQLITQTALDFSNCKNPVSNAVLT